MVASIRDAWTWLTDKPHQLIGLRILQVAVSILLLFRVATEARFSAYLYGPHSIADGVMLPLLGRHLGPFVQRLFFGTQLGVDLLMLIIALSGFGLLVGYQTRLSTAVACFSLWVLDNRLSSLCDGGDNITQLILTYMIFALPVGAVVKPGSLRITIHNVAMLAIGLQLCVLYETSGMLKASGDRWVHGTAMYYISQVEWFSLPSMRGIFRQWFICMMATYIPIMYQVMFPVALVSRVKIPWLMLGVCFHIGIMVFMGLFTFSTVMMGLELFLITDIEYAWIAARWRAFIESADARWNRAPTRMPDSAPSAEPEPALAFETVAAD